jgi:hypothetical protein
MVFLCREKVGMSHALHRRRFLRAVELLWHEECSIAASLEGVNGTKGELNDMDEYVMMLDSKRIQLVAKLKAIFDRFVSVKDESVNKGYANGEIVEQMLVYMSRPIDSTDVNKWLNSLKDNNTLLTFSDFVLQYCVSNAKICLT